MAAESLGILVLILNLSDTQESVGCFD